jgi:RNA polymerase sigma factor (sigma-70 family)
MRAVEDDVAQDRAARRVVEILHAANGQQLFGFARRLGLPDAEAEEVVQEAMLRLWRSIVRGPIIDSPVAWAFRTTYRLAMDRHRVRRRWQDFVDRYVPQSSDPVVASDELLAVWSEVDRLPSRQRAVLYLRYRTDLTFEVIGQVLGIDPGSARSNASRGIATLRARLGEEG